MKSSTGFPGNGAGLQVIAWLRALRLPFYPMSWLGYTLGCSLVVPLPEIWRTPAYWWGYGVVFMIEALTVFLNDLFDFESDRRNQNHSSFTGGSRVLVEGILTRQDLKLGCVVAAAGAVTAAVILQSYSTAPLLACVVCMSMALMFGVGYTAPPLKFSHRGYGEVVVAFAHSLLVIQTGALVVGGKMMAPSVIKIGLPLFFAILPSISLAGIPDCEADKQAGKATLAVKVGIRPVTALAGMTTVVAVVLVLSGEGHWPRWSLALVALHAAAIIFTLIPLWLKRYSRRIDAVIFLTLAYVGWFVAIPLFTSHG